MTFTRGTIPSPNTFLLETSTVLTQERRVLLGRWGVVCGLLKRKEMRRDR